MTLDWHHIDPSTTLPITRKRVGQDDHPLMLVKYYVLLVHRKPIRIYKLENLNVEDIKSLSYETYC